MDNSWGKPVKGIEPFDPGYQARVGAKPPACMSIITSRKKHCIQDQVEIYFGIMDTIAIPKTEYRRLRREADAYRKIAGDLNSLILRDSVSEAVHDFKKTGLYTEGFLRDLETGLRRSSYGRAKKK